MSQLWFDTFSVRPECRALRGVSKERTENTHHERTFSAPQYVKKRQMNLSLSEKLLARSYNYAAFNAKQT